MHQDESMAEARIGTERNGLTLSKVKRVDQEPYSVDIQLNVPDLQARRTVAAHYANGFDDLIDFFRGLATSWRGWPGERTYESLEDDLRLTAVHNGQVQLTVRIRQSTEPDGWDVKAFIRLDPGEEMTSVFDDIETLFTWAPTNMNNNLWGQHS